MPEGQEALINFMEESGFITIGAFDFQFTRDVIFIKDLINFIIKDFIQRWVMGLFDK